MCERELVQIVRPKPDLNPSSSALLHALQVKALVQETRLHAMALLTAHVQVVAAGADAGRRQAAPQPRVRRDSVHDLRLTTAVDL